MMGKQFNNDPEWIRRKAEAENGCEISVGGSMSFPLPPEEIVGNLAAESLRAMGQRLREAKRRMDALLREVGEPATCKTCKADVIVLRHASRERHTAYNPDGAGHSTTCAPSARNEKECLCPITKLN